MIRVENLRKSFGDNVVLDGITTDIHKGEVVVLLGPSGCGKSTFLRCLNRLEVPDGGKIFLDDVELTDKKTDIDKQRLKMMMVFQHFNLFPHLSILENLTIAPVKLLKQDKEEAKQKAAMLSVDPALMPFVVVLASVEGGDWNVTAMKVKNASVLLCAILFFG